MRTKRITFENTNSMPNYEDLNSFVEQKEKRVFYDQLLPYTERLKVEIDKESSYIEVFVTVLPTSIKVENQVLISIPACKYCFLGPISINNLVIKEKLQEANEELPNTIEQISDEIAEGINNIFNNIMNLLKNG